MFEENSAAQSAAAQNDTAHLLAPGAIAALIASMLLVGTSFGAVAPLVSAILENRGFNEYFTGSVTAILSLAIALFSAAVGRWVERQGTRKINLIGILGQAVGFAGLGIALATNELLLLPVRFGLGIAATMTFVAAEVALLRGVAARVRGRVMAAYGAALTSGFMFGVFASNVAYDRIGLWCFGLVAAIAVLIAPLAWFGLHKEGLTQPGKGPAGNATVSRAAIDWGPLWLGLFGAVVFGALDTAISGVYPVEGQRLGFSRSASLNIVGLMALGLVLGQPLAGWLADKQGVHAPLTAMGSLGVVSSIAAGYVSQTLHSAGRVWIALAYFGIGVAVGGIYPISLKLLADRAAPEALPHVNARFSGFYGYSALGGPACAAVGIDVLESHGYLGWAMPALCGVTLLAFLLLVWQDRKRGLAR